MINQFRRHFLSWYSPKAFNDGLDKCNQLGMELLQSNKRKVRLLDVGCGDGTLTLEFASAARAVEIHGLEYVEEAIKIARKKGIRVKKQDLNLPWKGIKSDYFDYVVSSQNIEHMHNTRLYLEECYRVLKKGGKVVILTENLASLTNLGSLFFGWQPFSLTCIDGFNLGNPLTWHIDNNINEEFKEKYQSTGVTGTVGHVRVLAYKGLEEMVKKIGFKKVRAYTRGYLPFFGWVSDLLCKVDRRHGNFLIAEGVK